MACRMAFARLSIIAAAMAEGIVSGLEERLEADGSLDIAARQVIAMLVLEMEGSLA